MDKQYICHLTEGTAIQIEGSDYKVINVKGVHKTKRRYERSAWFPKGAGYDSYKLTATNVFTNETIIKISSAETQFNFSHVETAKYHVIDIDDDILTAIPENCDVIKYIKIINANTYFKINEYVKDETVTDIIATILTASNSSKIIDLEIR